ncbi:MAG: hypothetical protein V3U18_04825 [Alphaproteobacteria bacterium]
MTAPALVLTDVLRRRALLSGLPNPGTVPYVVRLEARIGGPPPAPVTVKLFYVPDRLIVEREAFGAYAVALAGAAWPSLEEIAVTVLDDVSDELVPRWIRVVAAAEDPAAGGIAAHVAMVEDHQPNWSGERLLARLDLL